MSRSYLLGAACVAALCVAHTASAQAASVTELTGGGSTLAEYDYFNEFATFNAAQPSGSDKFANPSPATGTQEPLYWASGSGGGQAGLLYNDLTCDVNKVVSGATPATPIPAGTACDGTGGTTNNTVAYGASDATLTYTQINGWTSNNSTQTGYVSNTFGQTVSGNLIQLPSMGVGVAIVVKNPSITKNGQITLTDADICGALSGKFTNWNQLSGFKASKATAGTFTVVYRNDGSGTSFLTMEHLAATCNSSNSNFPGGTVLPTTSFVNAFTNNVPPANFQGEKGSPGVATELNSIASGIGYLSPDFTNVDPNSDALSANPGLNLWVAAVKSGKSTTGVLPTEANVALALNNPLVRYPGDNSVPPSPTTPPANATAAALPQNWVPLIETVAKGYPIVGYTTFDFAQCYKNAAVASAIEAFLTDHYQSSGSYYTAMVNNGFVPLTKTATGAVKGYATAILNNIVGNAKKWNVNFNNTTKCKDIGR